MNAVKPAHTARVRTLGLCGSIAIAVAASHVGEVVAQGSGNAKPAVAVTVSEVAEQETPLQRVYTGTTAAVRGIELQAQVTGYLLERRFTEGSNVARGDTLYVIDPAPFQAELDKSKAELQEQEAVLAYAKTTQERYAAAAGQGAAAQERLDQAIELQAKTEAAIGVSKADVALAQINLDYSEIRAPFDGRVGRTFVNVGALVQANATTLATLVQLDPIYVYFSPPETELLAIEERQRKSELAVQVTLPRASTETFKGKLTFIGNTADAQTGTITMRATIPNPDGLLRPGQFARVTLDIDTTKSLVVPARAIASIQGQRFVMVVGKDNKLERRNVTLGRQVGAEGYIVDEGLSKGELVVVSDVQTLKSGEVVSPQHAPAS